MHLFITGGAGFIGCNSADYFIKQGHEVTIFDNLSRKGTDSNLQWLRDRHQDQFNFIQGDIRQMDQLSTVFQAQPIDAVLHLAGQVAVTTSVHDPRTDFEINALGTFNVLEATRLYAPNAVFVNASTNKVYGGMEEAAVELNNTRYQYADLPYGVPETTPLDFHSPYGCSKGTADQYVIDYARIYGLRSVSMRQSCIYGPRQFGVEDQGWVAHFIIAVVKNRPITIFGDGHQVRDVLHIDDLVRAYDAAIHNIDEIKGEAINLGGGPSNSMSIWSEFGDILSELHNEEIPVQFGDWRPGDQKVFIADIRKAADRIGWEPQIGVVDGITTLYRWVKSNPDLF